MAGRYFSIHMRDLVGWAGTEGGLSEVRGDLEGFMTGSICMSSGSSMIEWIVEKCEMWSLK